MNFLSEGRLRGSLRHLRTMLRGCVPQALGLARLPIAALPVLHSQLAVRGPMPGGQPALPGQRLPQRVRC